MYIAFEYTLLEDPQAKVPKEFCIRCGCELYSPTLTCLNCERRKADDTERTEQEL